MEKAKHTPAPWYASEDVGEDGERGYWHINSGVGFHVSTQDYQKGFHLAGWIGEANARLIAAAPELLEALKNFLNGIDTHMVDISSPADELLADALRKMRAAIAKATGVQP